MPRSSRLAFDTAPSGDSSPPGLWQMLGESRAMVEAARGVAALIGERSGPSGNGPVLVVPGLLAGDSATWALRRRLANRGWQVYPWRLGINRGPQPGVLRRLAATVRRIAREHGRPVQIVGWSLGGVLARIVAWRTRAYVSQVVTLGSPLSGDPACSRLGPVFNAVCGALDPRRTRRLLRESRQVSVTSICSPNDGVVSLDASCDVGPAGRVVQVDSTHLGLVVDPRVLDVVARQLAMPVRRSSLAA